MIERLNPKTNCVAVFGGEGNMGKITVGLFQNLGYEVIISDPKNPDSVKTTEAVQQSEIIFFSVLPIEEIEKIVGETEDLFGVEHIVIDNSSLKQPLVNAYKRLEEKGVSICSTHPLCKHDQPLHGQKVLILEVGKNPQKARGVAERLYKNAGMITIPLAFKNHDRTMIVVQLVPHLVMRSVGQALEKSGVNLKALNEIAPANFQLFNLSLWRTLVQDPRISATLITNLLKDKEGEALAQEIHTAVQQITKEKDEKELVKLFEETYSRLNREGLGLTMNEATTIVLERLANLQVKSITIETLEDKPGLLRQILLPFEEQGINLTAIDSHKQKDKVKFEIGIDENTYTPEALQTIVLALQKIGCSVTEITSSDKT